MPTKFDSGHVYDLGERLNELDLICRQYFSLGPGSGSPIDGSVSSLSGIGMWNKRRSRHSASYWPIASRPLAALSDDDYVPFVRDQL
ncbi:hypothetical protein [Rhizobium leguminosarum]|uniref:hypothetical protein n=1 Tax=Rhizobium leguminosarum TaxID=384 RepID=UPI0013DBC3A3|nr:hypothetical protein [Rhizobium leguminosarum]